MRIGILTFHNAHNYGAVLQAYALKTQLTKMGCQVSIVNYRNQAIEQKYQKELKCSFESDDIFHPGRMLHKYRFKRKIKYMQPQWTGQYEKFEEFINEYLIDMPEVKKGEIGNKGYDILIVGSDQIWTEELTGGLDSAYMLDFPYQGRRVAYGGSNARGEIPQPEEVFIRAIKKFDFVSARERVLAQDIANKAMIFVREVLDPTLLLNREDYSRLEREYLEFMPEKYIFAYYVSEDKKLTEVAQKISGITGMKVIELHYYWDKKYNTACQFADFGPREFLTAVSNAEYVVTNSFHGTVFSILYRKKFYAVSRNNARIQNLLHNLGITNRNIYSAEDITAGGDIIYDEILAKLENYRKDSIQFLMDIISN